MPMILLLSIRIVSIRIATRIALLWNAVDGVLIRRLYK